MAVIAVLGLLVAGRYLGWYGGKPANIAVAPRPSTNPTPNPTSQPTAVTVSPAPPAPTPAPSAPKPPRPVPTVTAAAPTAGTTPPPAAALITDWEQRIDKILTTEGTESAKSKELLEMLPNLPEEGQVEAAQHLSNLLADEEFKMLTPTFTNAAVPEAVLDVLMTDVLNRPNQLKLPALLDVARIPNHPKAEEARDILEVFVDENYGQDWNAWRAAVDKWLKENPDE
jgi:hypothetical protein